MRSLIFKDEEGLILELPVSRMYTFKYVRIDNLSRKLLNYTAWRMSLPVDIPLFTLNNSTDTRQANSATWVNLIALVLRSVSASNRNKEAYIICSYLYVFERVAKYILTDLQVYSRLDVFSNRWDTPHDSIKTAVFHVYYRGRHV